MSDFRSVLEMMPDEHCNLADLSKLGEPGERKDHGQPATNTPKWLCNKNGWLVARPSLHTFVKPLGDMNNTAWLVAFFLLHIRMHVQTLIDCSWVPSEQEHACAEE